MQLTTDSGLTQALRDAFAAEDLPARLGVAVSGGSDSLALMHLLADWAADGGPALRAVTVDHGLRPESAAEALAVAQACAARGVAHDICVWQGWGGKGNLMDAARRARLRLIGSWAGAQGIGMVALGHTAEDQAETFLMRLARGSGVDGLSAMAPFRHAEGLVWVRPMLRLRRADLRAFLTRRGVTWADDPTNDDDHYDRVKARRVLALLAPLGITVDRLGSTAGQMAMARAALEDGVLRLARTAVQIEAGDVVIRRAPWQDAPQETRLRLLAQAIRWVSSADYRPRLEALLAVQAALLLRRRRTLGGCLLSSDARLMRISREPRAAATAPAVAPGEVWDARWRLDGPPINGLQVRALGPAGLALCPGWRVTGLRRATLLASPAVWRGADLVAAPLARPDPAWAALSARDPDSFFLSLLSH